MNAIAPNLTIMVGELVGARLIAHSGSLLNLAKHPASTVQILGAEKALFRALKTKHDTPKYGLLYHASVVGQSQPKNKGKMSRVLAAKTVLMARFDAFAEEPNAEIGLEYRGKVDARHRQLEGLESAVFSGGSKPGPAKVAAVAPKGYSADGDVALNGGGDGTPAKKSKKEKKEKKEKKDKEGKVREKDKRNRVCGLRGVVL
jgi:nucleolar protein 58